MIEEMWEMCQNLDPDSLECTLLDWNMLGHYYSFRLSEWAQNDENKVSFPHWQLIAHLSPLPLTIFNLKDEETDA